MTERHDYSRYRTIQVREAGALHRLSLNRPAQMNAIDAVMCEELDDYLRALEDDLAVRVVLLDALGKNFCAGLDLGEIERISAAGSGPASGLKLQRAYSRLFVRMRRCPQPFIALVQGAAAGAGLALALASDVRYAAEDARFNVAMARIGMTGCDLGISYFLPRAVGTANAAEMMMGGRFVDAKKALRIGLVSEIAPREQLEAMGLAMAEDMLRMSPVGLRLTKDGLNASQDAPSLDAAVALEDRQQVLCIAPYLTEGAAAFLQKRPPNYPDV
jgi:enoyl-CoA hydratase